MFATRNEEVLLVNGKIIFPIKCKLLGLFFGIAVFLFRNGIVYIHHIFQHPFGKAFHFVIRNAGNGIEVPGINDGIEKTQ